MNCASLDSCCCFLSRYSCTRSSDMWACIPGSTPSERQISSSSSTTLPGSLRYLKGAEWRSKLIFRRCKHKTTKYVQQSSKIAVFIDEIDTRTVSLCSGNQKTFRQACFTNREMKERRPLTFVAHGHSYDLLSQSCPGPLENVVAALIIYLVCETLYLRALQGF